MATESFDTDYLIIGAGAMGLAFADTLFEERPDCHITLVDKRAKPGGHWNDAYPFVTLHQPAAFYGVNSSRLGKGGCDLSSRAEIVAYFERVLQRLTDSGRVRFLPMCEYRGEGEIASVVDSTQRYQANVRQRVVDASYMNVEVPATHPPRYTVGEGVNLVPVNGLARLRQAWDKYVVIGAGKTGIDAVLFLLDNGVAPERIQWVVSNDMWLWNRGLVQAGIVELEFIRFADVIVDATSLDEVFLSLEKQGSLMRIDPKVMPTKWRCATVSREEFEALKRVQDVLRMGRVKRISAEQIELEQGSVPTSPQTLHIDCSANGLAPREPRPIFADGQITLQSVFMCQQVFSAAVIAHLETMRLNDAQRNAMWKVVPHPEWVHEFPQSLMTSYQNVLGAQRHMPLWLRRSRLNAIAHSSLWRYLFAAIRIHRAMPAAQASINAMSA